MQLYLYLFFSGLLKELADRVISFLEENGIEYKVILEDCGEATVISTWFAAWITPEDNSREYFEYLKEEYNVVVNNEISFQLYPGCSEELFSRFIAYLLESMKGDMFLSSECDELILLRNSEMFISKESWKGYLEEK